MAKHRRVQHRSHSVRTCTAFVATATVAGIAGTVAVTTTMEAQAADGPDWSAIIACESGGNPAAQNPSSTASGLFQFLDTSWIAYGGGKYASRAKYATPAQQTEIANHAYALSGLSPWAASQGCWSGKVSAPKHAAPSAPAIPLPVATAPKHAATGETYTVQQGDTLSAIAAVRGLAWEALYATNQGLIGGDPDQIYPGQTLRLP